jgi:hypothetical protein
MNQQQQQQSSPILSTLPNKTVSYSDHQKLTQEHNKLKQKYHKLKTEHSKLKEILDNYIFQIDEYTNSKILIEKQIEICKQKIIENEKNIQTNHSKSFLKYLSESSFSFSIVDNVEGDINYPELKDKYRNLKEEQSKSISCLGKLCSTSNSTNVNIKSENKFQHFKNTILEHYINSIDAIPHRDDDNNSEIYGHIDKSDLYYEPVPSIIKFLKKY